jgi:hypothetical protein
MTSSSPIPQWLRRNEYRYDPTAAKPATEAVEGRYQRATSDVRSQMPAPQAASPQEMGRVLADQGAEQQRQGLDTLRGVMQATAEKRRLDTEIDAQGFDQQQGIITDNFAKRLGEATNSTRQLQGDHWDRGLSVARELRGMGADTTAQVASAIGGEQSNDRYKLEILDRALKPTLVDNIAGLAGSLGPLLAAVLLR